MLFLKTGSFHLYKKLTAPKTEFIILFQQSIY